MKDLLNYLYKHNSLTREEAKSTLCEIGTGKYNNSQIASFLTVFIMRSITSEELKGFRDAMLELCVPINLEGYDAIDIVGTGGDGKNTFNISTTSSFVVAGAGIHVAKHGNYGVSSSCGSSNVLEHLGVQFTNNEGELKSMLDRANFCMMHAPLFHPAMKHVAPVRKEMGVRTFFNMLGPMVNPSKPKNQFLGVYSLELARLYGYVYQGSDVNYKIIYALDGYDEISLTSPFKVITEDGEALIEPKDLGLGQYDQKELHGGDTVEEAAKIFTSVLNNESTLAQKEVVIANAALAIQTIKGKLSIEDTVGMARESLESGNALNKFKQLVG